MKKLLLLLLFFTGIANAQVMPFGMMNTATANVPGTPTNVSAAAGNGEATATFTAPANNGGSPITSYTATSSPDGITGTLSQAGSGTITVTGLTNGTSYTFTVTATNANGIGAASSASISVIPSTVPDPPTIGTATATGVSGVVTVSFTAPSDGGSSITSYTATSNPDGITSTVSQSGDGSITVTGLSDGTPYTFTVTATNAVGTSGASAASNLVIPKQIAVGDSYGGGIVIYIKVPGDLNYDPNVDHGIISYTENIKTNAVWIVGGSTQYTLNGNTSTAVGSGQANTTAMMAQTDFTGGAAKFCSDHFKTVDGILYDDWYLPSIGELKLMYQILRNTTYALPPKTTKYASSSEYDKNNCYYLDAQDNGKLLVTWKAGSFYVRPARSF